MKAPFATRARTHTQTRPDVAGPDQTRDGHRARGREYGGRSCRPADHPDRDSQREQQRCAPVDPGCADLGLANKVPKRLEFQGEEPHTLHRSRELGGRYAPHAYARGFHGPHDMPSWRAEGEHYAAGGPFLHYHHHPHHPYHAEGRPRAGTSYGWGKTTMWYTPMVDRVKDDEPSEEAQPQPPAGQSDSVVRFLDRPEQGCV